MRLAITNLVKLVTAAYLDGYYYKPRVDKELLAKHSTGLIALSGCLKGEINGHLMADQTAKARESMGSFRDIFAPGDFYVELHDHGMEAQHKCNRGLIDWRRNSACRLWPPTTCIFSKARTTRRTT